MQLLHPFMPFITEEIYHQLRERNDDIAVKQFREVETVDKETLVNGELLKQTITAIRDAKNKNQLKPRDPVTIHILAVDAKKYASIESVIGKQVSAEKINYVQDAVPNTIAIVIGKDKFFLQTTQELDTTSQREQILKDIEYFNGFLVSVEKKLGNERFVQNAKPEIVESEKRKKEDALQKIKALRETLANL
jgi:valyl-tRNA synthetase